MKILPLDLIYCAGGNELLSHIAFTEGWQLGFRSDKSIGNFPVAFVDINYRAPNFDRHVAMVKHYRPRYATVPDLSEHEVSAHDVQRALAQVEQIAPYCQTPLIVPKLPGQIKLIPADVALGYSVPSRYGGAQYPLWELAERLVHLLGGSPHRQWQTYLHVTPIARVTSIDANYAQKMATQFALYWEAGSWKKHPSIHLHCKDIYYECWRLSCQNIRQHWLRLTGREEQ